MNESTKTLTYLGVALAITGAAWALYPRPRAIESSARVGELLFRDFTDADAVESLEIKRMDEALSQDKPLKLARQTKGGSWVVASSENYPAGVMDRVADAASALAGLKIIDVASEKSAESGDHQRFGVVDPAAEKTEIGAAGVGTRVTVRGAKDRVLAELVIGKPVKEDQPDVRYVRAANDHNVYTAKVKNFDKFTTKLDDWIETGLLEKFSSSDVRRVVVKDRTVSVAARQIQERSQMRLAYDNDKAEWKAEQLMQAGPNRTFVSAPLKPDEQLNSAKLSDLTYALGDLRIVDVDRKGESARKSFDVATGDWKFPDLEPGELLQVGPGLYALREAPRQPVQIMSSEGEIAVTMKDGVEFVLHFGDIAGIGDGGKKDAKSKDDNAKDDKSKKDNSDGKKPSEQSKIDRWVIVSARFNPEVVPKPVLLPIPDKSSPPPAPTDGAKEGDKSQDKKDADKPGDDNKKPDGKKVDDKKSEDKKSDDKKSDDKKTDAPKAAGNRRIPAIAVAVQKGDETEKAAGKSQDDSKKTDAGKPPTTDDAKKSDAKKNDAKKDDVKKTEAKPDDAKKNDAKKNDAAKDDGKKADATNDETKKPDIKQLEAEWKLLQADNDRKKKEYEETLKKGQRRVQELNARFADWYYVISEDSYRKLHLTRDDVVKKKDKPADEKHGLGNFPGAPDVHDLKDDK